MRVWLDLMLKKNLDKVMDRQRVDKFYYLEFMKLSTIKSKYIKILLEEALTDEINNRDVFMKGLDQSYRYEDMDKFKAEDIDIDW